MKNYVKGSILEHWKDYDVIIFNVNGSLTKAGHNVMGRGVGKVLAQYIPQLPQAIGAHIKERGFEPTGFIIGGKKLFILPTKNKWYEPEDRDLILKFLPVVDAMPMEGESVLIEFPVNPENTSDLAVEIRKWMEDHLYEDYDVLL